MCLHWCAYGALFFSVKIEECTLCTKAKSVDFLCRVLKINAFRLVGMTRFELATSTSRTLHATNCATSRKLWILLSSAFVSACHSELAVLHKTTADFILDGKDTTFL